MIAADVKLELLHGGKSIRIDESCGFVFFPFLLLQVGWYLLRIQGFLASKLCFQLVAFISKHTGTMNMYA